MTVRSLARLRKVQAEMVRLAELRLAMAERTCRDLDAARTRLDALVAEGDGALLTEAALRSLKSVGARAAAADAERLARQDGLTGLRRRGGALEAASRRATLAARRTADARALADVLEARAAADAAARADAARDADEEDRARG